MAFPETELEMARRHVREGEWHVKRQKAIVTRLEGTDGNSDLARDILERRTHRWNRCCRSSFLFSHRIFPETGVHFRVRCSRVRPYKLGEQGQITSVEASQDG